MNWARLVSKMMPALSPSVRRQLKAAYERLPGFGRKTFYSHYGEDAFLQGYFQQKLVRHDTEEMQLPIYLQSAIGNGYYVDVGANAPIRYSNTYWFYKRGWCGINIDAAPGTERLFRRLRPRDILWSQHHISRTRPLYVAALWKGAQNDCIEITKAG